jgi:ribosomal protein L37AE/L43A
MGLFGFGKKKSWEEENAWDGSDSQDCPRCGQAMTKRYQFSDWWCKNCGAGLDDDDYDDDDSESLSVWDAAEIWLSNGKDEDYMFGYTEEELEDALK